MSYILDALNKAARETSGKVPGLDTVQGHAHKMRPNWTIPIFLLVLVLLNGVFLVVWLQSRQHDAETLALPAEALPITVTLEVADTTRSPAAEIVDGELITPADFARRAAPPLRFAELPLDVRQQLPGMTFSSHIYADEPSLRLVSINGKGLHEGDMVNEEVRLIEITVDGVVLQYLQFLFEIRVLQDWSAQ
jgi:hypothetical protein